MIALELSYERHRAVHDCRYNRGLSLSATARELNLSIGSVRHYLSKPLPSSSPADVISAALEIKSAESTRHYGPMQISGLIDGVGSVVSETTLSRRIKAAGLAHKGLRWRGGSRPYWMDAKYTSPLECFQVDTVKLRVASGELVEVFSCRDVVSGVHHLSIVDGNNLSGCLAECFRVMGVPSVVQADNGFGMILANNGGSYSDFQQVAWLAGVSRIHYIPEAEPDRNGAVESFHRWLQYEYLHAGGMAADVDGLCAWLGERLRWYCTRKPLGGLGGKRARKTPASVHPCYDWRPVANPLPISPRSGTPGVVSFTRLVDSRGALVIRNPGLLIALGPQHGGHYVRVDIYPGGRARCFSRLPADEGEGYTVERINGRLVSDYDGSQTREIAIADTDWCCGRKSFRQLVLADVSDASGEFQPVNIDDRAWLRTYAKALRKPMPSSYPRWVVVDILDDGSWTWTDSRTGLVVASSRSVPDHSGEM